MNENKLVNMLEKQKAAQRSCTKWWTQRLAACSQNDERSGGICLGKPGDSDSLIVVVPRFVPREIVSQVWKKQKQSLSTYRSRAFLTASAQTSLRKGNIDRKSLIVQLPVLGKNKSSLLVI